MNKLKAIIAKAALVGENLEYKEHTCLLVKDDHIEDFITESEMEHLSAEWQRIDLRGSVILPGMFDCHNHLALDARIPGHLGMMELSECEHTVLALKGMKDDLMSGVTTSRYMGDRNYIDVKLKKLVQEGKVIGPDLLVCGIGMRAAHGHGFVGMPHSGAEDFRRTCRENLARGVDHLKIFITPGTPVASPEEFIPCYLTMQEVRTVVEEAASVNAKTTAHCIGGKGLDYCIDAGVDVIDHLYSVTPMQIKRLEEDFGGWVDMTSGIVLDESREAFTPEAQNVKMRRAREYSRKCINQVYQSGKIRFTLGTDAYHGYLYREVGYAVEGGASSLDAVKAVTVNAAKMTGSDQSKGQLAKDYIADIIAVPGNPIEDVGLLGQVSFVMKHGKIYKH